MVSLGYRLAKQWLNAYTNREMGPYTLLVCRIDTDGATVMVT